MATLPAPRTGILLLNMGGPKTLDDVEPFLQQIFADREIITLPWQSRLGPWIAKRRTPKVRELYRTIGGGSPILHWNETQGRAMTERLTRIAPEHGPYTPYVAFRYTRPFADEVLRRMADDGIERVVAFSQYPQWSCTTSGSSVNDLAAAIRRTGLADRFAWSLIDRWGSHPGFVASMATRVAEGLARYPVAERDDVLLLFSAHSIPLSVVQRGDPYPAEIAASTDLVLRRLNRPNPHLLAWQSSVGPVTWLGPSTEHALHVLAAQGRRNVLVVPIAFTSDHIETLAELDIEYGELAGSLGIDGYQRAPALNDLAEFTDAMATIVAEHLRAERRASSAYGVRCVGCTNEKCRPSLGEPRAESRERFRSEFAATSGG